MLAKNFILIFLSIQIALQMPSFTLAYSENSNASHNKIPSPLSQDNDLSKTLHSLDIFQLLGQTAYISENAVPLRTNPSFIELELVESDTKTQDLSLRNKNLLVSSENIHRSIHIKYGGQLVNSLPLQIRGAGILGNYLVFIQKQSYDTRRGIRNLSFIDLGKFSLGNSSIPIFRVPVETQKELSSFKRTHDHIEINGKKIFLADFKEVSTVQETALNLLANLLNPKLYIEIIPHLKKFLSYATGIMKARSKHSDIASPKGISNEIERIFTSLSDAKDIEQLKEQFLTHKDLASSISKSSEQIVQTRGMIGRANMILARMSIPVANAPNSIVNGLQQLAIGILKRDTTNFKQSLQILIHNKILKVGAPLTAAFLFASVYPDSLIHFLYTGVDTARMIFEGAYGKLHDGLYLGIEATKATFAGLNPDVLHKTYIENGKWNKTLQGAGALFGVLFTTLGVPHIVINMFKLASDLKNWDWHQYQAKVQGSFKALKKMRLAFINRQNLAEERYIESLAAAERKINNELTQKKWTAAEEAEVREFIHQARAKDFPTPKFVTAMDQFRKNREMLDISSKKQIQTFGTALAHFFFSYSSFTNSGAFYAKMWNYWFIGRTLLFRPQVLVNFFVFPSFFKTAVLSTPGEISMPTKLNGGLDSVFDKVRKTLFNPNSHKQISQWESEILSVESEVNKILLKKSFSALVDFASVPNDLVKLYSEKSGFKSYTDNILFKLSAASKVFFRIYYEKAYQASMKAILNAQIQEHSTVNTSSLENLKEMKTELLRANIYPANFSKIDFENIIDKALAKEKVFQKSSEHVNNSILNFEKIYHAFYHSTLGAVDPNRSGQFKRFAVAAKQVKKAPALARAVRSSIAKMLVDKPMELMLLFVMIAGVSGEFAQPIHEMKFSENSWFYLSRNQFLNGYVSSLVIGLFSDIWMKLQKDDRLDAIGEFDAIPKGKLAKKGFLYNMREAMWSKENSWWNNQKYYAKLIWANMGAALVTITTINYMAFGRLDLDSYIAGYLISYLSPLSGLGFKVENAFEKAAKWVYRDIPQKYLSHPEVIKYGNETMSKLRIRYNFFYSIYENITGHLFGNLQNMSTTRLGPRSFVRWVFAGFTPTELLINNMDHLADKHPKVFGGPAKLCRAFFLNNYTDGVKLRNK